MVPKPIMEWRCRIFPTFSCFSVCPQYWSAVPMRDILTRAVGAGPNTAGGHASVLFNEEVQVRRTPELVVSSYASRHLVRACLDPAHDAIDQTYPHGRGAVIRGARRGELEIQLVVAEAAGGDGVEFLQLVLSPRERQGQNLCDVPRACESILVAGAAATLFGLRDRWRGTVAACGEAVGEHLDSPEIAWGLDCGGECMRGMVYVLKADLTLAGVEAFSQWCMRLHSEKDTIHGAHCISILSSGTIQSILLSCMPHPRELENSRHFITVN